MRILNEISDQSLKNIILYLTFREASELRDSLNQLLRKPLNNHAHIPSEDFEKEITLCVYDMDNLEGLDEKSVNLILND